MYLPPVELITIDLKRAEQAVSSLPGDKQQGYQPKTITSQNLTRKVYLPIFPTEAFGPNNPLLLANVSGVSLHINISIFITQYPLLLIVSSKTSCVS